ncbi:MAG: hypothetical protein M3125_04075, partial [Gemmatimonadota bacterium]|nr:hypothetical protein [Gemmatimonadota bacterium]
MSLALLIAALVACARDGGERQEAPGALSSGAAANAVTNPAPDEDESSWVRAAKDYASWRYSTLDEITTENVVQLRPAWTFSTGVLRGQEAFPL